MERRDHPALPADADHIDAERVFAAAGWTPCGTGDWAIALRSPDGRRAVRISPFDPTGPYTAELYRRGRIRDVVTVIIDA
ncbi:hypothetical protein [Microbacterium sp.]|uniref:hypothetical protein n=1 Tax=Microbacterium sp. TaxID=51671 RepID=UPI0039E289EC